MEQEATTEQKSRFRNTSSLTRWVKWILYAHISISAIAVGSGLMEYRLLSDFKEGVYESQELAITAGEANDTRQQIVGITQMLIFLISGVLILRWIYFANFNARRLGAREMEFTPAWAVGWYFIPIANLWKPYQAMKEIWQTSSHPASWKQQAVSSLLPWWWFFWLVSGALGNASFRLALKANEMDELILSNIITQLSDISEIPISLLLLGIVTRVHEMQMTRAKTSTGEFLSIQEEA